MAHTYESGDVFHHIYAIKARNAIVTFFHLFVQAFTADYINYVFFCINYF